MDRVVIFGRGGAGKSALAHQLGVTTGLPVIELDKEFWSDELKPLPAEDWARHQAILAERPRWIIDGDLGPYDHVEPRLRRADTVVVLDTPLWLCAWRAWRRGPQRRDFWDWTVRWRRHSRPRLLRAASDLAPRAEIVVLRGPRSVRRWLVAVGSCAGGRGRSGQVQRQDVVPSGWSSTVTPRSDSWARRSSDLV